MNLCLYHANCNDGFGAAYIVWLKYPNCEFIPMHYGDDPPDVTNKDVCVVDFSFSREVLLDMHGKVKSLIVIDHHKTAQENLNGLDFCIFDMNKSGCVLTYEYFYSDLPIPELLLYLQDRDLWKWKLPNTKEISAAITSYPMDFEIWEQFRISKLEQEGVAILRYQQQQVDKIVNSDIAIENIGGYDVPCINATHLISELGNELSKDYPFAALYFDIKDKRVFSLRSCENGIDVSEIAKQFAGGGHKHAAGFTTEKPKVLIDKG